ncbi:MULTISPECIES: C40 family peptidase [unclassified Streptomyces]|uniref:C40 family peptidase n=1 Tax=unclassified Streptomyces TaxID=2593676 RepID=UPI002E2C3517|nr:NlpC/P60 family protein [Streptomyces sp. NBC_00223]
MASHSRRPASRRASRTTARAALTLVLASAASLMWGETAHADPGASVAGTKARVDALYRQAEQATEDYDGAKQQSHAAGAAVAALQDELARKTARLNSTRDAIGSIAAAQYRSGSLDPGLQLALSSSPDSYLEKAGMLNQLGGRQTATLARLAAQRQDIELTRARADAKLAALRTARTRLAERKQTVRTKLHEAQELLDRLTAPQRASVDASEGAGPAARTTATRSHLRLPVVDVPAPSARAAQAVAFAYRALGSPYVWGATGPGAFDCSGLTQAAWRSAGVSLPRTTYTQINAGTRVAQSQLRPGDLVFFYSGVSHVGLYIGNGQMIHAPHPGAAVRIAPISEMPFAGATRPS